MAKNFALCLILLAGVVALAAGASTGKGRADNPADKENEIGSSCQTRSGEDGTCAPFKSCYPAIFRFEQASGIDSQLLLDVLESTTPCGPRDPGARRSKDDVVCCTTMKEKPASDVTIVESLQSTGSESETGSTTDPIVPSSCVGANVVDIANHFGADAPRGAYPFMAALTSKGRQFCGGSIIDNYHILTAAHCVAHITSSEQVQKIRIILGANNLKAAEPERASYEVASISSHGNYSGETIVNDIAVIRLAKSIQFTKFIQPICLNKADDYADGKQMATLSGWGRTSVIGLGTSPTLRHATMRVWNNTECQMRYAEIEGSTPKVEDTMVCAGSPGIDACQGDSGGPLFMKRGQNSFYEQIGVVSWGVGCGLYPAVYTRVDRYQDWLEMNRMRKMKITPESESSTSIPPSAILK